MIRLIRYNLRNQLTKISTYVTPLIIFTIIMIIKAIMNVDSGLMNIFNNIGNEFFFMSKGFFVELAIFIGALIFVGMTINNIYKVPKEDGSIMAIVSKPLKRKDMILGNLLSLGICLVLFGFTLFIFYGISTTLDNGSSINKILSSVSVFIGVIVIVFIFASIILLIGSYMNSKSLIIFSIVTGVFIPLISIVISLTAEPELTSATKYKYINAENFIEDQDVKEMYLDLSKVVGETAQQQEMASGKIDLYKSLSFIDPWYQLSGLFNLFNDNSRTHINWSQTNSQNKGTIVLDGKTYSMISEIINKTNLINDIHTISYNLADKEYRESIKKESSRINALTFEKQIMIMNAMLEGGTMSSAKSKISVFVDDAISSTNENAVLEFHEASPTSLMFLQKMVELNLINQSTHTTIKAGAFFEQRNLSSYLFENNQNIATFTKTDYINKTYLFIFWSIMALVFFGLTILVEFKRDIISQ